MAGDAGCRVFGDLGERETELAGRRFSALSSESQGTCIAVIDGHEIWRRELNADWTKVATVEMSLQSVASSNGMIFAGGMDEAAMVRVAPNGEAERLAGFDRCAGREEWFAGGPPLGVRSLAATSDGATIIAAVHVGGLPYSTDGGQTWTPTAPVGFDVHEVRAHPTLPKIVVAASAVGLCVSNDGGRTWEVVSEGLETTYSLGAAVLPDEALFTVSNGPFPRQSQIWRWRIGSKCVEQVRDGLPEWLDGKVDTAQMAAGDGRVALADGGGSLWVSHSGSVGWKRVARDVAYPAGIVVLPD